MSGEHALYLFGSHFTTEHFTMVGHKKSIHTCILGHKQGLCDCEHMKDLLTFSKLNLVSLYIMAFSVQLKIYGKFCLLVDRDKHGNRTGTTMKKTFPHSCAQNC